MNRGSLQSYVTRAQSGPLLRDYLELNRNPVALKDGMMKRRDVLCGTLALLGSPSLAQRAPITALTDYERGSGGRIGLCAENLRTGANIAWRAHERFVMCSTFKASLAACVLAGADRGQARLDELIAYGRDDLLEYARRVGTIPVHDKPLARSQSSRASSATISGYSSGKKSLALSTRRIPMIRGIIPAR
jgi:hypothetical protein